MMSIGEFAALTGLTVRALRFYDEQGVLVPAEVDASSRYRRYSADQLTPAIRLNALREAGVPLDEAARALRGDADAGDVIETYRARVAEERARQDANVAALDPLWPDATARVKVSERQAEPCHWAGVVLAIDPEDADVDRGNEAFGAAWKALTDVGNPPTGAPWSSFRVADDEASPALLCCWPVADPVPADWAVPGWEVVSGALGAGPELVASWTHTADDEVAEGATHPAVVALLQEAERRGVDVELGGVRQIIVGADEGMPVGVEVAAALRG